MRRYCRESHQSITASNAKNAPTATIMNRFTFVVRRLKSTSGTPLLSFSIDIASQTPRGPCGFLPSSS